MENELLKLSDYISRQKCPMCGSVEINVLSLRTFYNCGSSDYDQRPNTFEQSIECVELCKKLNNGKFNT